MSINWGALQSPQQPARVVAQLPQNNSTNNVLSGLVSGLQSGQQMAATQQSMEIQKKQDARADAEEGRSAQLFPSQLAGAQAQAQMLQQNAAAGQQTAQDSASLRKAAQVSEDAWLKEGVKQQGPIFAVNYQKAKADADKAVAEVAQIHSNNTMNSPKVISAYSQSLGMVGAAADQTYVDAYNQVMSGQGQANTKGLGLLQSAGAQATQSGQITQLADKIATDQATKAFDLHFSQLDPVDQKVLKAHGLDTYSMATTGAFKSMGTAAMIKSQEEQENKNATPTQKAQKYADQANNALAANPNDPHTQEVASNANKALQTAAQGPKMIPSALDKINEETSVDAMKNAHEQSQKNIPIIANLEIYKQQMQGFTSGRFAETDVKFKSALQGAASLFGIKPINTNAGVAEQLDSINSQLKLQFASEIKNARMNTQMFKALSEIPPSIENTPQGAALKVDRLLYIKRVQNAYTDFQDRYIQQNNGNPQGVENQWNKFLQNAPLLNKDGSTNVQHLEDDSSPYLNPKYTPPKSAQSFSQNQFPSPQQATQTIQRQSFQKGQIVRDANGNKAKYVGGDPKDPRSYQEVQ